MHTVYSTGHAGELADMATVDGNPVISFWANGEIFLASASSPQPEAGEDWTVRKVETAVNRVVDMELIELDDRPGLIYYGSSGNITDWRAYLQFPSGDLGGEDWSWSTHAIGKEFKQGSYTPSLGTKNLSFATGPDGNPALAISRNQEFRLARTVKNPPRATSDWKVSKVLDTMTGSSQKGVSSKVVARGFDLARTGEGFALSFIEPMAGEVKITLADKASPSGPKSWKSHTVAPGGSHMVDSTELVTHGGRLYVFFRSQGLTVAVSDDLSPAGPNDWQTVKLFSTPGTPYLDAAVVGGEPAVAAITRGAMNNLAVSYAELSGGNPAARKSWETETAVSGLSGGDMFTSGPNLHRRQVKMSPALAELNGAPAIAFHSPGNDDLNFVRRGG